MDKPCGHLLPCNCATTGRPDFLKAAGFDGPEPALPFQDPEPPHTRKLGRDLAADEEHAPGCVRDHFGPGTHTCEPIPIEAPSDVRPTPEQLAAVHAELTGGQVPSPASWKEELRRGVELLNAPGGWARAKITAVVKECGHTSSCDCPPERVPALDAAEHAAQVPEMLKIGLKCTCTGPEIPDGGEHQVGCPRYVAPEDPFTSNRIGDIARQLMLEQARERENVARSAVTYVLDEMGRAIDTIRQSTLNGRSVERCGECGRTWSEIGDDVIVHFAGRPVTGRPLPVQTGWEGDQFVELPADFATPADTEEGA